MSQCVPTYVFNFILNNKLMENFTTVGTGHYRPIGWNRMFTSEKLLFILSRMMSYWPISLGRKTKASTSRTEGTPDKFFRNSQVGFCSPPPLRAPTSPPCATMLRLYPFNQKGVYFHFQQFFWVLTVQQNLMLFLFFNIYF